MNPNRPVSNADVVAAAQLAHLRVHRSVARRIWELYDGGLDLHEIAARTGYPVYSVRVILRGGPLGAAKP